LVELAFECHSWKLKLKEPDKVVVHGEVATAVPNPTAEILGKAKDDEPPPSFFLLDRNWVEQPKFTSIV
jgi:hypothetical protein